MSSGVCVIWISFPAALSLSLSLGEPSGLELVAEAVEPTLLLYLRHLGEQADGHGQRQAEGNQAHEAVDGQQQPAVALQEAHPIQVKTGIKGNVSPLCASIPDDSCGSQELFLDVQKRHHG